MTELKEFFKILSNDPNIELNISYMDSEAYKMKNIFRYKSKEYILNSDLFECISDCLVMQVVVSEANAAILERYRTGPKLIFVDIILQKDEKSTKAAEIAEERE